LLKYESVIFFLPIFCNFTIYYKFLVIENSKENLTEVVQFGLWQFQ